MEDVNAILTEHSFRAEGSQIPGRRKVDKRGPGTVAGWKKSLWVAGSKSAVLERPHRVEPRLACTVHKARIDPAGHLVHLQHKKNKS